MYKESLFFKELEEDIFCDLLRNVLEISKESYCDQINLLTYFGRENLYHEKIFLKLLKYFVCHRDEFIKFLGSSSLEIIIQTFGQLKNILISISEFGRFPFLLNFKWEHLNMLFLKNSGWFTTIEYTKNDLIELLSKEHKDPARWLFENHQEVNSMKTALKKGKIAEFMVFQSKKKSAKEFFKKSYEKFLYLLDNEWVVELFHNKPFQALWSKNKITLAQLMDFNSLSLDPVSFSSSNYEIVTSALKEEHFDLDVMNIVLQRVKDKAVYQRIKGREIEVEEMIKKAKTLIESRFKEHFKDYLYILENHWVVEALQFQVVQKLWFDEDKIKLSPFLEYQPQGHSFATLTEEDYFILKTNKEDFPYEKYEDFMQALEDIKCNKELEEFGIKVGNFEDEDSNVNYENEEFGGFDEKSLDDEDSETDFSFY